MTLLTTSGSGSSILTPEQVEELVIQPLIRDAIATQVSTVISTLSHDSRFPIVKADPTTAWTLEGEEITPSDSDLDELVVTPKALKGLTVCSNELVADSDPSALSIVGDGLVRDLALKLDAAFFGTTITYGPDGIGSLATVQDVDAGSAITDLDWAAEALSKAEAVGSAITSFVASPANVLAIATLKTETASIQPLLGPDPSSPTRRSLFGVPLYSSPAVADDVIWAIPKARTFTVVRMPASLAIDSSAFFSSDRSAVRAVLRVAFGFPHEQAIIKIGVGGS